MALNQGVLPSADAKTPFVRAMFDRIAPRYDRMNRLMTFGLDQRWRRELVTHLELRPGARVLDLATGTGDLAELCRARGARPLGIDLARAMLSQARRRAPDLDLLQADGARLPLRSASVDALTCGFALRNFTDLSAVLRECARVLRGGGRLGLLEVDEPPSRLLRTLHGVYFRRVVPRIGGWLSDREAYRYLPESTAFLPPETELRALLRDVGFARIEKRTRMCGAIQAIVAERAR